MPSSPARRAEILRRQVGADDTRVIVIARPFGERAALSLGQLAQDDREVAALHGAFTGRAHGPVPKVGRGFAGEPPEGGEDEIVPHLVPFERCHVVGGEVAGLHGVRSEKANEISRRGKSTAAYCSAAGRIVKKQLSFAGLATTYSPKS
jgi:hypothetical protein